MPVRSWCSFKEQPNYQNGLIQKCNTLTYAYDVSLTKFLNIKMNCLKLKSRMLIYT